jgi:protein involved in polysaccharide export with SLBB domain
LTISRRKEILAIFFRFLSVMITRMFRSAILTLGLAASLVVARAAPEDRSAKSDSARPDSSKTDSGKSDYVLQPQDVIKVQVFPEEGLMREERISQEYTISLPYIGTVDLKGKTAQQAREIIRERYDRDYLVNPQVSVLIIEYAKKTVSVIGQVNTPGVVLFPQEQGLTIVEAISRAGGPTRLAKMRKVVLKRMNPDGTTADPITINVDEIMKGDSKETWPLKPNDVIYVPERSI